MLRTVWGEARGEHPAGWAGVAHVIANRARRPRWWGRDIASVCLRPWQFSCWNEGDPNRELVLGLAVTQATADVLDGMAAACRDAIMRRHPDPTNGADHYLAARLRRKPAWATATPSAIIGGHRFFRLEE